MDAEILKALDNLARTFGPGRLLLMGGLAFVCGAAYTIYKDWRKDRDVDRLIAAKEAEIERVAADNRSWRTLFFKVVIRMTDEEIVELLNLNTPADPIVMQSHPKRKRRG